MTTDTPEGLRELAANPPDAVLDAIAGALWEDTEIYWSLEYGREFPRLTLERIAKAALHALANKGQPT